MEIFNIINIIFVIIFFIPIVASNYKADKKEKGLDSIVVLFDNLEYLSSFLFGLLLTKWIFFSEDNFLKIIKALLPEGFREFLESKQLLTYMIATPIISLLALIALRAALVPVYQNFLITAAKNIADRLKDITKFWKVVVNGLFQVPKAMIFVIIYGMGLSFYTYHNTDNDLSIFMNSSSLYKVVFNTTLTNVLNSDIAKSVPVIENGNFGIDSNSPEFAMDMAEKVKEKEFTLKEYLDGKSVEEVIKPITEIKNEAVKITKNIKGERQKALLIYQWIVNNIQYDEKKGIQVGRDPSGIPVGASVAFMQKKGICFDYASLYTAMCNSVGIKVRFITGIAYTGRIWGDHAWNQVFIEDEGKWLNVDSMFGKDNNYYDKVDFNNDHKYPQIRYEG